MLKFIIMPWLQFPGYQWGGGGENYYSNEVRIVGKDRLNIK